MRLRKKAVAGGLVLVAFTTLVLLLSATSTQHQDVAIPEEDPVLETRVLDLQERLRKAEAHAKQKEDEISAFIAQMGVRDPMRDNITFPQGGDQGTLIPAPPLSLPSIHTYLPHLSGHPEYLRPAVSVSKSRKGVSIVIGVPTIKRDKTSYLKTTLTSLVTGLNALESNDCVIVLFIAEPWDQKYAASIIDIVKGSFSQYLDSGLLEILVPPAGFYPDLNNLKENFGDTKERVKWRTKQNLDYAFLMLYARLKALYYVQMEDDVIAKPGYLSIMKTFALQQKADWLMLEFSALGFIGKMFKSSEVPIIVEFFLMFHADKPIDWLIDHLLWVKVCNPEKDAKHCQRMIQAVRRRFKPSLFQHIGLESSLKGKVQKLKDRDFGKVGLYRAHVNPPVEIASSLKTYQKYSLIKAYTGETFFWASNPSKGDIIDFKFTPPISVDMYLFRSGNADHPGDVFHNTTIEVKPKVALTQSVIDGLAARTGIKPQEGAHANDGYIVINKFNDLGLAQGEMPEGLGVIEVLRVHVHEPSNAWVILSEIMIKESKR